MTDKPIENSVFRILDAAINRAGEGVRVVEDYVRMVVGDAHLSEQLKQLRHDVTDAVATIDPVQRIAARDSVGDVGRTIETESEYRRDVPGDQAEASAKLSGGMIQANLARAQQALRTIEEFTKSIDPDVSRSVEQLRYRSYTIEKAVLTTVVSQQNLADSNLYDLIDGGGMTSTDDSNLMNLVNQLIEAEVDLIQLRDQTLTDRQRVEAGRAISNLTRGSNTRFIMNDRADLALAANADGVHLGQDDLKVADARRIVGAAKMIGVSTHSIEQARQAVLDGANYIGVGPVFASQTKQFDSHVGLELVAAVAGEVQLPSFAIGGISLDNITDVVGAGLSRVAVSAAIAKVEKPGEAARKFKQALLSSK
jgi:thiamine-phosphate pyrophosphorylase